MVTTDVCIRASGAVELDAAQPEWLAEEGPGKQGSGVAREA